MVRIPMSWRSDSLARRAAALREESGSVARKAVRGVALLLLACAAWPWGAPSANTLKFCNWHHALLLGQAEYVAGVALLGDQFDRYVSYRGLDQVTFGNMKECAADVRRRICTDPLLMGLLDPTGALLGGTAGALVDAHNRGPSLLGGMLGAGVLGTASGVVKLALCNKAIEERYAPSLRRLGAVTLPNDLGSLNYQAFSARVVEAMRAGRLSPQEGSDLLRMTGQIAEAARRSN